MFSLSSRRSHPLVVAVRGATLALVVALACALSACQDLLEDLLEPDGPFSEAAAGPPPDYTDATAWAARPDRADPADETPAGVIDQQPTARADVFFVHPTTHLFGQVWNAPVDRTSVNAQTDATTIRSQASAFNRCCRVWAPRYRQAILASFIGDDDANRRAAKDLAWTDVRRAFRQFLVEIGPDRPFVLAAHSQGSLHLVRLLEEELVADDPALPRLVAAYPVGYTVPADKLERTLGHVPLCTSPRQTGCMATWATVGSAVDRSRLDGGAVPYPTGWEDVTGRATICVNPLSWRADEVEAPADANLGSVRFEAGQPSPEPVPGFTSARCDRGLLMIPRPGSSGSGGSFPTGDFGSDNFHIYDYAFFYMNLRANAAERVDAFVSVEAP